MNYEVIILLSMGRAKQAETGKANIEKHNIESGYDVKEPLVLSDSDKTSVPTAKPEKHDTRKEIAKAYRLSLLGWTQKEIGQVLGVNQTQASRDMQYVESDKVHILDLLKRGLGPVRNNFPPTGCHPFTAKNYHPMSMQHIAILARVPM